MKKKILLLTVMLLTGGGWLPAQTGMKPINNFGTIREWEMTSGTSFLANIFSIEKSANCELVFHPKPNDLAIAVLALTGTYSSDSQKVAGNAYKNCVQIGNPDDQYFKPNSYLVFAGGKISFSDQPGCQAIQVYKLISNDSLLTDVIDGRRHDSVLWRFFVEKKWTKICKADGHTESGSDLMIVDFQEALPLAQACNYVASLARDTVYQDFSFKSTVTAGLLDSGSYRPLLLDGSNVDGVFDLKSQTNVIVIER